MSNNAKVELTGNLGQDPRIISQEGKKDMIALSIATTDSYKNDKSEWVNKEPVWHNVLVVGDQAVKFAKEMQKGDRVTVRGDLSYKEFESKEGHKIQQASIVASYIVKSPLVGRARE